MLAIGSLIGGVLSVIAMNYIQNGWLRFACLFVILYVGSRVMNYLAPPKKGRRRMQ